VLLPLLLPFFLSWLSFRSDHAAATALSAEINVLLLSAVGALVMLLMGLTYLVVVQRKGRAVMTCIGSILAATTMYLVGEQKQSTSRGHCSENNAAGAQADVFAVRASFVCLFSSSIMSPLKAPPFVVS
jgi:hypothetical protein